MALDLNALINNPQFQTGMALFGASSPKNQGMLQAYQLLQKRKESEQEAELNQARLAAFKEQNEIARLNAAREKRKAEQEENLTQIYIQEMKRRGYLPADDVAPQVPGAVQGAAPAQPMQQPSIVPPAPEVDEFGTPKFMTGNLKKVESGGNPLAVGPLLPEGDRAKGAYQFRDSTRKMLSQKYGYPEFDPFNEKQSERAASFYIQKLKEEHGGDYAKALAAYGGFKAKDPSSYVNKIMGSPEKMAQQRLQLNNQAAQQPKEAQFAQLGSQMDDYNRTRALAGLAAPASEKLKLLAELDKPHTYTPGQVVVGPKGTMQVPDPMGQQRIDLDTQRVGIEQQRLQLEQGKETRQAAKQTMEVRTDLAKAKESFSTGTSALDRLDDAVADLMKDPGLSRITGTMSLTNKLAVPGYPGYTALQKLEGIKSKLVNDTLQAMRAASKNGASGYGQFTEKELEVVKTYIENLEPGRADFPQALAKVREYVKNLRETATRSYEESTGDKAPKRVVRTGKDKSGRKVVQYSDGTVDYAD